MKVVYASHGESSHYRFRRSSAAGNVAAAECSGADPFLQLANLTSGQAKNPTRALKKTRASLTLQLRKLTSGQAFGMTEALRLRTAYMRLSTVVFVSPAVFVYL
jgi:hypothetical protein